MRKRKQLVKSKIVCTIGPSSREPEALKRMAKAGMSVGRINFSHGTREDNGRIARLMKEIEPRMGIICDIQGPRIRVGRMAENVILEQGDSIKLTSEPVMGDNERAQLSYKRLDKDLRKGDKVYINDGIISLEVEEVGKGEVVCRVLSGGLLSSNKGVNLPSVALRESVPTKKDLKDLESIASLDIDYVAVSFVGGKGEVILVRRALDKWGGENIRLISKIERQSAVDNFEDILDVSDAIMVARGDLGVETSPEMVPKLQKDIIRECNREGKPVIVATQMLESMVLQPVPTRAEANDVFNAVLDGADALMLSGETSIGRFPVKAVSTMSKIAAAAETSMPRRKPRYYDARVQTVAEVLGQAVHTIVGEFEEHGTVNSLYILTITRGGYSARMISKYRPPVPVFAATPSQRVRSQLSLLWGVQPFSFKGGEADSTDDIIKKSLSRAVELGWLRISDFVIILCASSLVKRKTNVIGVFKVDEVLKTGKDKL